MSTPSATRAMVLLGERRIERWTMPVPEVSEDDAIVRVLATGVCGADWDPYVGRRYDFFFPPVILGHEVVGEVVAVGDTAASTWGVRAGDRVVLEEPLPCGRCRACVIGRYQRCDAPRYGSKTVDDAPGLWGGYSEYLYLAPNALVHKVAPTVDPVTAAMYVPLSNGIEWLSYEASLEPDKSVLILGPGQQGLGCVIAARHLGADRVYVAGLDRDRERLEMAKHFGATEIVNAGAGPVADQVRDLTDGAGADIVINVASGGSSAFGDALQSAAMGGTVIQVGTGQTSMGAASTTDILHKELRIRGVRGRYAASIQDALRLIEAGSVDLTPLSTHQFPLDQTETAIRTMGGEVGSGALHVTVCP